MSSAHSIPTSANEATEPRHAELRQADPNHAPHELDDSDAAPAGTIGHAANSNEQAEAEEEELAEEATDTDLHDGESADLESQLQSELEVHAQIAEHLAAIQRLRGSQRSVRARTRQPQPPQPVTHAAEPDAVARAPLTRLASISLQRSAPDVADVLRTRRAIRSFMQHNRSRSEFTVDSVQLDLPVAPAAHEHQRDPSSTSLLSLQIPRRSSYSDVDEEHAATIEVEPLFTEAAGSFTGASLESRPHRSARASPDSSFRSSCTHSRQSSATLLAHHADFPLSADAAAAPSAVTDSDESPESQRIAESAHHDAASSDVPERIFDSLFAPVPAADPGLLPPAAAEDEAGNESILMQHRSSMRRRSNGATLLRSKSPSPRDARSPRVASTRPSPAASPGRSPIATASEASPVTAALPPRSPMQPSLLSLGPLPLAASDPIGLSSMTEPPAGSTLAVPSSPNSAEANGSAPGLNRATSLPPVPSDAQPNALKRNATTPPTLSRASTVAPVSIGDHKPSPAVSRELLSVLSPPPASSISPLSPSTWLQQRMGRIFQLSSPAAASSANGVPQAKEAGGAIFGAQLLWKLLSYIPALLHVLLPCIILFQSITLPVRLAFGGSEGSSSSGHSSFASWRTLDLPLDTIFLLGVLFSDYIDPSTLSLRAVLRRPGSARRAAWINLAVDLLSALPLEFLGVSHTWVRESGLWHDSSLATSVRLDALVRLPRLLRLARLFSFLDACETRNLVVTWISPTLFRLFKLGTVMYVVAHLAGCGYVLIGVIEGLPADNLWICPVHIRSQSLSAQYLHAIHWGLSAMTGNGSGVESPNTLLEHAFALFVLLVGVSTYATLIGNLSNIISSMNTRQDDFRAKMTSITNLMNTYHLPEDVQTRVKSCFQYLFVGGTLTGTEDDGSGMPRSSSAAGTQEWDVLEYLPAYLRNEVLVYLNGEIIQKVPLFRGCSDGFVRSLVPLLRPEVVIPGDYIIRTGEIGRELYLLRHGILEVVAHGVVVATLTDGSYVGEVAVMFEQKRTASVRALTFCDVLVLSKEAFDSVLSQYPEVQRSMRMQATMRRNARSMQDKERKVQEIEKAMAVRREAQEAAATAKRNAAAVSAAATRSPRPNAGAGNKTRIMVTPVGSRTSRTVATSASRASHVAAASPAHSPETKPIASPADMRRRSAGPFSDAATAEAAASRSPSLSIAAATGASNERASSTARASPGSDSSTVLLTPPADSAGVSAVGSAAAAAPSERVPKSKWKKLRLLTRGQ